MWPDPALLAACLLIAALIALPALQAAQRRRFSRESSEVANALIEFAASVRRTQRCVPIDAALLARARRLGAPEMLTFEYAQELARPDPALLADTTQRLGLRLKRRVAFERKMLARTASGRRRGALAAGIPPAALLALGVAGEPVPLAALALLLTLEALGCWLLWQAARVQV